MRVRTFDSIYQTEHPVRILIWNVPGLNPASVYLSEVFRGFPHYLNVNLELIPPIMLAPFPSTSTLIYYLLYTSYLTTPCALNCWRPRYISELVYWTFNIAVPNTFDDFWKGIFLKTINQNFLLPRCIVLLLDKYIFYEHVIEFARTTFTFLIFLCPHFGSDQQIMSKVPDLVLYECNCTFTQYKPTNCTFSKLIF